MPRIRGEDKVRCECSLPYCRGMVSVATRRKHERTVERMAQDDANEHSDGDNEENSDNENAENQGEGSREPGLAHPAGMDGQALMDIDDTEGINNTFDDEYNAGAEDVEMGSRSVPQPHIRPAYRWENDSDSDSSDSLLGETQIAPPQVEDFDVFDYNAQINADSSDEEPISDSESSSSSTSSHTSSENRLQNMQENAAPLPPAPIPPAIANLAEVLNSPYHHYLNEKCVKEEQLEQDHLDRIKRDLTDNDIDNLIGFSLRTTPGFNSTTYERVRAAFDHRLSLHSTYKSDSFAEKRAGIGMDEVDCCVKSCMAFTGDNAELQTCTICGEPRYNAQNRRRNASFHFSIVDRLRGMFQDVKQSEALNRDNAPANNNPDVLADKFDGEYFQKLRQKTVEVQGIDTGYHYFSDGRDISLTVSLDGFTFFETVGKHTSKTKYNTWLVIAMIDNLSPLIRTQRKNIMVLAVIPGPGSPKDLNSYLHWLKRDLHILAIGVLSWDAAKREWFLLRAFLLWVIGDMPAIAHIMNMKGHNGMCPCRECYIKGSRNITQRKTNYYPALLLPNGTSVDIDFLLSTNMRAHENFVEDVADIQNMQSNGTAAAYKRLQQDCGINGWSILYEVNSINFPCSFPHDLMHLAGLNTIPNLVLLWTGEFTGLKDAGGDFSYIIEPERWNTVGERTENANKLIPYAFSRAIPNVARKQSMTADAWFFWFLAIAPYALQGILKEPHYSHAMDLARIIRTCMKFQITRTEVSGPLTGMCIEWVQQYERLYYQGREDRLAACASTVHAWLHIPQDTLQAGPIWQSWAFPMEREVQWAKAGVKHARNHPFIHMAGRAKRREQIKQLGHRFGLSDKLDIDQRIVNSKNSDLGPKHEQQANSYIEFVLCSPRKKSFILEGDLRILVAAHLAGIHEGEGEGGMDETTIYNIEFFSRIIPNSVERWGKVRISGAGDSVVTSSDPFPKEGHRDASFIRYHMNIDGINQVLYGQLQHIFKFELPSFDNIPAKIYIVTVIRPCVTDYLDATASPVIYTTTRPLGIADLTCLVATVGRVPMGDGRYGIVDRSTEESWPTVYEALPEEED